MGLLARSSACPGSLPACGTRFLWSSYDRRCSIPSTFGAWAAGGLLAEMQAWSCSVRALHAMRMHPPCHAHCSRGLQTCCRDPDMHVLEHCAADNHGRSTHEDLGVGHGVADVEGLKGWLRAKGPCWSGVWLRFRCGSGGRLVRGFSRVVRWVGRLPGGTCLSERTCSRRMMTNGDRKVLMPCVLQYANIKPMHVRRLRASILCI